jgi:MFS family permease
MRSRLARLAERDRVRRNLRLLWFSQFVNTAGLMMLVPIMPLYMERLGAGAHTGLWAGAAVAAPALPLALVTPLWGRLGDRIGRKWMVVRALLGLAVAMGVMAAAGTPVAFMLARLLQGTFGGVVEAATAFVSGDGDDDERGSALGRSYSATAAGALTGPLVGGALLATGRLQGLMLLLALAAAVLAVLCAVALRERGDSGAGTGPSSPATDRARGWWTTAARELRPGVLAASFFAYFGVYGLIPVYATYIEGLLNDAASAGPWIGGLHAVMWTGTLVGSFWWGRVNDRRREPLRALAVAALVTAASMVVQAWTPEPIALVPLRFLQGFCFAAIAQSVLLHAGDRAPTEQRAGYVGVANAFLLGGQFTGPLVAGAALAVMAPSSAATVAGVAVLLAALLVRTPPSTRFGSVGVVGAVLGRARRPARRRLAGGPGVADGRAADGRPHHERREGEHRREHRHRDRRRLPRAETAVQPAEQRDRQQQPHGPEQQVAAHPDHERRSGEQPDVVEQVR